MINEYTDKRRGGGEIRVCRRVTLACPYIRRDGGETPHGRCGLSYGLSRK